MRRWRHLTRAARWRRRIRRIWPWLETRRRERRRRQLAVELVRLGVLAAPLVFRALRAVLVAHVRRSNLRQVDTARRGPVDVDKLKRVNP